MHELARLDALLLEDELVVLGRVGPAHEEGAEATVGDDGAVALGDEGGRDLDLVRGPGVGLGVVVVVADVAVEEVAELVAAALGLAGVRVLEDVALLPLDVLEVEVDERGPDGHGLVLEEAGDDQVVEGLVQDLQLHLLLELQEVEDLREGQRYYQVVRRLLVVLPALLPLLATLHWAATRLLRCGLGKQAQLSRVVGGRGRLGQ
mmetsp:Transcript_5568/g.9557  ORF Transcript_5568/g.9557 Transcript_5568/m.9557 type:complete len:205 (+) Transcript_5568:1039-1653(+)